MLSIETSQQILKSINFLQNISNQKLQIIKVLKSIKYLENIRNLKLQMISIQGSLQPAFLILLSHTITANQKLYLVVLIKYFTRCLEVGFVSARLGSSN